MRALRDCNEPLSAWMLAVLTGMGVMPATTSA